MREVVREEIVVNGPPREVWSHLAQLKEWPSWAGHIRRMDPTPPGELTADTRVVLHMSAGPRATMKVTEYDPPHRWVWEGRSMGVTTRFEHKFEEVDDARTRIWFQAWTSGPLSFIGGRIFGRMMPRYLTVALPRLKAEIERR